MARRRITHDELDRRLDELARDPEHFEAGLGSLTTELDSAGVDLEITDPTSWRKPSVGPSDVRVPLRQQFRHEVESMTIMDRESEARLARRIEFARMRLDRALEAAGLSRSDLIEGVGSGSTSLVNAKSLDCSLPAGVCRRWLELHRMRSEMVERNLYLVLINVERYSHTTANQNDLIQEGCAALFRAVDGFDWKRGLLFRTYAVHWLNQAFRSHLYNFSHTVRVPVYLQKALKHINDAKVRLGDPNASAEKIAEVAGLGVNLVVSAMAAARSSRSIDASYDDQEDGGRLRDLLETHSDEDGPYSTQLEDHPLEESLKSALDGLGERERYVVQMRFGIGTEREHTLAEVAGKLGVSLERVRQIQVRALSKLRSPRLLRAVEPFLN